MPVSVFIRLIFDQNTLPKRLLKDIDITTGGHGYKLYRNLRLQRFRILRNCRIKELCKKYIILF